MTMMQRRQGRLVGRRLMPGLALLAGVAFLAGCGSASTTSAPSSGSSNSSAAGTSSASPSATPPAPSLTGADYNRQSAAAVLKDYLNALAAKNAAAACVLDARTAPANPKQISLADCVTLMQGRISGKDWANLEVDCWAGAKDTAACAGMDPVPAKAEPNELGNFVFDSTRQGFTYAAGIPDGCDPKNSTGCWFVVVHDPDGRVSVAAHWGERVYR